MFTSSVDHTYGTDFGQLGEDNKFTWHQFHFEVWGAQYLEGNAPVAMHNTTGRAVSLTCLLLNSQSKVELIVNEKMLVNIRKVRGEDAIRVHSNIGVNILDRVSDLPGYGTVWYKPIEIANFLSMSMATNKFRVFFNSEGGNYFQWSS